MWLDVQQVADRCSNRKVMPMDRCHAHLLLSALPAVSASFAILAFGGVGQGTWMMHLIAIFLSAVFAVAGGRLILVARIPFPSVAVIVLSLTALGLPLFQNSAGPHRWVELGAVSLYMAPVIIPSFLVACSVCIRVGGNKEAISLAGISGISLLLAAQPDASQALALLLGSATAVAATGSRFPRFSLALLPAVLVTGFAFYRPDPLEPVPHVEGVFALAFEHSLPAGIAVAASSVVLLVGLCISAARGAYWLFPVPVYYATIFACSIAGLTPAPLVGFGTGPLLGFGVLVIISRWVSSVPCLTTRTIMRRWRRTC